jgi:beta-glucosidase/6-phospho-beta-glucosidase/beta-galactosidase
MTTVRMTIPDDFILGAAASAWQTEGWSGLLIVGLTLCGIGTAGGNFDERQIDKHRDDDADKLG